MPENQEPQLNEEKIDNQEDKPDEGILQLKLTGEEGVLPFSEQCSEQFNSFGKNGQECMTILSAMFYSDIERIQKIITQKWQYANSFWNSLTEKPGEASYSLGGAAQSLWGEIMCSIKDLDFPSFALAKSLLFMTLRFSPELQMRAIDNEVKKLQRNLEQFQKLKKQVLEVYEPALPSKCFTQQTESELSSVVSATDASVGDFFDSSEVVINTPGNLQINNTTPTSIEIKWEDLGNEEIGFYKIERSDASGGPYDVIAETNDKNIIDADLTPDTTYYYRVKKAFQEKQTPPSQSISTNTDELKTPNNININSKTKDSIKISWDDTGQNIDNYVIYRKSNFNNEFIRRDIINTGSDFVDNDLSSDTNYEYFIRSQSNNYFSNDSPKVSSKTLVDDTTNNQVSNINITDTTASTNITWDYSGDFDRFAIYRKENNSNFNYIASTTDKTFEDTELTIGNIYQYNIRVIYNGKEFIKKTTEEIELTNVSKPNINYINAINSREIEIEIAESNQENFNHYNIYRSQDSDVLTNGEHVAKINSNTYKDESLLPNTKYYYAVTQTIDKNYSNYSDAKSATTKEIPKPEKPTTTLNADNNVIISWPENNEIERYDIYKRQEGEEFGAPMVNDTEDNEYIDTEVENDNIYYYGIIGKINSIESEISEAAVQQVFAGAFAPSNLHITNKTKNKVEIAWEDDDRENAKKYKIYKKNNSEDEFEEYAETKVANFVDNNRENFNQYYAVSKVVMGGELIDDSDCEVSLIDKAKELTQSVSGDQATSSEEEKEKIKESKENLTALKDCLDFVLEVHEKRVEEDPRADLRDLKSHQDVEDIDNLSIKNESIKKSNDLLNDAPMNLQNLSEQIREEKKNLENIMTSSDTTPDWEPGNAPENMEGAFNWGDNRYARDNFKMDFFKNIRNVLGDVRFAIANLIRTLQEFVTLKPPGFFDFTFESIEDLLEGISDNLGNIVNNLSVKNKLTTTANLDIAADAMEWRNELSDDLSNFLDDESGEAFSKLDDMFASAPKAFNSLIWGNESTNFASSFEDQFGLLPSLVLGSGNSSRDIGKDTIAQFKETIKEQEITHDSETIQELENIKNERDDVEDQKFELEEASEDSLYTGWHYYWLEYQSKNGNSGGSKGIISSFEDTLSQDSTSAEDKSLFHINRTIDALDQIIEGNEDPDNYILQNWIDVLEDFMIDLDNKSAYKELETGLAIFSNLFSLDNYLEHDILENLDSRLNQMQNNLLGNGAPTNLDSAISESGAVGGCIQTMITSFESIVRCVTSGTAGLSSEYVNNIISALQSLRETIREWIMWLLGTSDDDDEGDPYNCEERNYLVELQAQMEEFKQNLQQIGSLSKATQNPATLFSGGIEQGTQSNQA